jgi:cytochrome P450
MAVTEAPREALRLPRRVRGLPLVGNVVDMARDPARFFHDCYRRCGPVFQIQILGDVRTVIAGAEAATFMATREGRECLRSREFWQGLVDEWGATKVILGLDGEIHARLRGVMKRGFSKEALEGRYAELIAITDEVIDRDWKPGTTVPVVEALQYMVVEQLGRILTGATPGKYLKDIRTAILYILNVLVTHQRPGIMLLDPRYGNAKRRVRELVDRMLADYDGAAVERGERARNVIDDIMDAHRADGDLVHADDLMVLLTGPYIAGLDTVANTTASCVYAMLKHPEVLARMRADADAFFAGGVIDGDELMQRLPAVQGAVMETMRLWPIAVAAMRTATRDFEFCGHRIREGEMLYVATTVPHFMEAYYPEPESFDIDRYEKPRSEHLRPGVYSPYGRGPHICLGKSLAEVLLVVTMARLCHRLNLSLDPPDYVLRTKTAPTPGPAMSFRVKVESHRHAA